MKTRFLHKKEGNSRLILIFGGWSCDEKMYAAFERPGWDTILCYGYDTFDFDTNILNDYSTIYLYAWSLGVIAAEISCTGRLFTKAFAIAGTPRPVDDNFGIPEKIFLDTTNGLSEKSLCKFRMRMCGGARNFHSFRNRFPDKDDIPELKEELSNVYVNSFHNPVTITWDKAYIFSSDLIFPVKNQLDWWNGKTDTVVSDGCHVPDFTNILNETLPDINIVREQFHNSRNTYDDNALAQKIIAERLADLSLPFLGKKNERVLEIGAGTGLFTSIYLPHLSDPNLTLLDIDISSSLPSAGNIRHIEADAEEWLQNTGENWDAILSASTVHWFFDFEKFLRNCKSHLLPGGILAVSGFLKGNLSEFDHLRPNPLIYPTQKEVEEISSMLFTEFEVISEELKITFPTPRHALLHLKNTGVSSTHADPDKRTSIQELSKAIPQDESGIFFLTYRPFYLIARKK